jgi:GR25 family glycosyltransferase involved in LPS biosynthesis
MKVAILVKMRHRGLLQGVVEFCQSYAVEFDVYFHPSTEYANRVHLYDASFVLVDEEHEKLTDWRVINIYHDSYAIRVSLGSHIGICENLLLYYTVGRRHAIFKDAMGKITRLAPTTEYNEEISIDMFASEIKNYVKPPYVLYTDNVNAACTGTLRDLLGTLEIGDRPNIVIAGGSLAKLGHVFEDFVDVIFITSYAGDKYEMCLIAKGFYRIANSHATQQSIWVNSRSLFKTSARALNPRVLLASAPARLDKVDIFYYINLDHRTDRNTHMISQFAEYDIQNYQRMSAIKEEYGALGCSKSHMKALELFLESKHNTCVILEDDFRFTLSKEESTRAFEKFFHTFPDDDSWDIVQLASNTLLYDPCNDVVDRCIFAITTAGYLINRRFAGTLVNNIREGIAILESSAIYEKPLYSIDVYWGRLQPSSKWYIFRPTLGIQMESYSDVVNGVRYYGV